MLSNKSLIFVLLVFTTTLSAQKGVYTDQKNHLQWEDAPHAVTEEKWKLSKQHCQALSLDGHNDWRLPTRKELMSLIPAAKKGKLHYNSLSGYWTSEATDEFATEAWAIYLQTAHLYSEDKCQPAYRRCVRYDR